MTPPREPGSGPEAAIPPDSPAVLSCPHPVAVRPETLQIRADFLKAASARRQAAGSFLLQARDRNDGVATTRVGFTASKKIGNAVMRNRAKRRLRAIAREILPGLAKAGWDYVLVARPVETVTRSHAGLLEDLRGALVRIHAPRDDRRKTDARPAAAGPPA